MKYVKSYFIEELPNGVFLLVINLTQREIYYHRFDDDLYLIAGTQKEYKEPTAEVHLSIIRKFLPEKPEQTWLRSSMHEKDQLTFVFTPYQKEWIKNRRIVESVDLTKASGGQIN